MPSRVPKICQLFYRVYGIYIAVLYRDGSKSYFFSIAGIHAGPT